MIGSIRGLLRSCDCPTVLIETPSGVGYEVDVPIGTLCPSLIGQEVLLCTHLVIREDAQMLFGFADASIRYVFRDLIKLSGVGPKVALLVLSSLTIEDLRTAVYQQDTDVVMQIKGIGKRVAEKMLIELKNKVDKWPAGTEPTTRSGSAQYTMHSDALEALLALGYPKRQAEKALSSVQSEVNDLAEWVRLALKQMALPQKESAQ